MLNNIENLAIDYITYDDVSEYGRCGICPSLITKPFELEEYLTMFSKKYLLSKIEWCINPVLDDCDGVVGFENVKWVIDKFAFDPENYESLSYLTFDDYDDRLDLYLLSKLDLNYPDHCKVILLGMTDSDKGRPLLAVSQIAHQIGLLEIIYEVERRIYRNPIKYNSKAIQEYIKDRSKPFQYNPSMKTKVI